MRYTAEQLLALLVECAEVNESQLTELCDAIDNNGDPYQSKFLADVLAYARENRRAWVMARTHKPPPK